MKIIRFLLFCAAILSVSAAEDWQTALSKTPFPGTSFKAHLTEPPDLLMKNYQPYGEFRGIVLLPGAADHIYFFDWGRLFLREEKPTLLDMIRTLTNRTGLKLSFNAPFLLIHNTNDVVADPLTIADDGAAANLKARVSKNRVYYRDRPYDQILPTIEKFLGVTCLPAATNQVNWHFYRNTYSGEQLTGLEVLRAMAWTMQTTVRLEKDKAVFTQLPPRKK